MSKASTPLELYWEDIKTCAVNGYGRIPALSDGQIEILCRIATGITKKHKLCLPKVKYKTREDLQDWTLCVTQGTINPKVFNEYISNVAAAYDDLENA